MANLTSVTSGFGKSFVFTMYAKVISATANDARHIINTTKGGRLLKKVRRFSTITNVMLMNLVKGKRKMSVTPDPINKTDFTESSQFNQIFTFIDSVK